MFRMMLRIVRRSPWIALGAAGTYYLDRENGPARRRAAAHRVRTWTESWTESVEPGREPLAGSGSDSGFDAGPLGAVLLDDHRPNPGDAEGAARSDQPDAAVGARGPR